MPPRVSRESAARLLMGLTLAAGPALSAEEDSGHRFTIHNDSPAQIIAWRVAAAGTRQWGPNLIVGAPVAPGEARTIRFGQPSDPCIVDVLVIPSPGEPSIAAAQNDCDPHFNGVVNFIPPPATTPPAPAATGPTPTPKGAP